MSAVGVIIVAAGRGQRLGGPVPKQLLDLGGRSILQRSVAAFDAHPATVRLVVVLPRDLVAFGPSLVGPTEHPCQCVAGGERRQDSVRAGLAEMPAGLDMILIHDAARPFVDDALIDRVIGAAASTGAALPALQARDTVKRVPHGEMLVKETIPREEIGWRRRPRDFVAPCSKRLWRWARRAARRLTRPCWRNAPAIRWRLCRVRSGT